MQQQNAQCIAIAWPSIEVLTFVFGELLLMQQVHAVHGAADAGNGFCRADFVVWAILRIFAVDNCNTGQP